jgi:hypothetical protein
MCKIFEFLDNGKIFNTPSQESDLQIKNLFI